VVLLRGVNVGGKNRLPMAELRSRLGAAGLEDVTTYIQSGNVVLRSGLDADALAATIERILTAELGLDGSVVRALAIEHEAFARIVSQAPDEFGEDDGRYRYYVVFLIDARPGEAMEQIDVRPGVDAAWQGDAAIYYRLPSLASPDATKSRLTRVTQKPVYRSMTIRNWKTTTRLLRMLEAMGRSDAREGA
jgi:uncharacterized protein (DUF1697 family)